jgi:hypothetical protein
MTHDAPGEKIECGSVEGGPSPDAPLYGEPLETAASPRTILVDGFNVLHAVLLGRDRKEGWWRRPQRDRLLDRVSRWTGGSDEIWVAFDGARPGTSLWIEPTRASRTESGEEPREPIGGESSLELRPILRGPTVQAVFVESADDWIVRRARRATHPESMIVVSADRKVAGRARSAGCSILTPWAFIARCPDDQGDRRRDPVLPAPADSKRSSRSPEFSALGGRERPGESIRKGDLRP